MEIVALIVRLITSATFGVAGISKLADLEGTRKGIEGFGLPAWAARPIGIALPCAELGVAVLLIPLPTVLWGSLGAIALLMVFITGISINLAQGRKPNCHCFGQLHSKPIGWPTLARNCILVGGAGLVLWQGRAGSPLSVVGWTTGLSKAETVGILLGTAVLVILAAQGWLTFHLLRQNGRLLLRMDALESQLGKSGIGSLAAKTPAGLPIGSPAPAFALPLLSGGSIALDTLRAEGRPILLIFSDPDCGPCSALLPEIARWEREQAATRTFALVSRGSEEANRARIGEHRLRYVLLQKDREAAEAYQANGTPSAVLIGRDGTIQSFLAMGSPAIAALAAAGDSKGAAALPAGPVGLKIGDPAPSLKLPDLSGKVVDLAAFRHRETLVLFWNPSCGFCAKMLPDLKRWEEHRPAAAPQLLVVSTGTVEANRAQGLRASVVLDQTFASGLAFRARGTPSAVLVDAEGKIASAVAAGAPAVFALANAQDRDSHPPAASRIAKRPKHLKQLNYTR